MTEYYEKEFTSKVDGKLIVISRAELESLGCPIDATQITDEQMQEIADKLFEQDEQTMLEIAEPWLLKNTKAKYIEDYSKKKLSEYQKRAKKLYYN